MANNPDPAANLQDPESPLYLESISNSYDSIIDRVSLSKDRAEHLASISYDRNTPYIEQEIKAAYEQLPFPKEKNSNIKFFGSSYSGVDIKVIAHMYDQVDIKDDHIEKVKQQMASATSVKDACTKLLNGGLTDILANTSNTTLTPDLKRKIFLAACGLGTAVLAQDNASFPNSYRPSYLSDNQQEAAAVMLSGVYRNNSFSYLGIAKMRLLAEDLHTDYASIESSLEDELRRLEKLDSLSSSSTITLGTLQTISVQSFREKHAVRALGHTYAKSYTRGPRTIGGSCIFTIFDENALASLIRGLASSSHYGERDSELSTLIPDQLPPLDFTIVFANEYGALSDFRLYGVEFFTDGSVFSIEDLLSEETMNFVCRDADIMTSKGRISISRLQRGMFSGKDDKDKSGTSLLFDNTNYYDYLHRLGVRRRLINR